MKDSINHPTLAQRGPQSFKIKHRTLWVCWLAVFLLSARGIAMAATVHVDVGHDEFVPYSVTIQPGDTVEWTWTTSHTSSVTSGANNVANGLFDAGIQLKPYTFSYTFQIPGTFWYFCRVDPVNMFGNVIVAGVPPPTQPLNISTRMEVRTGDQVLIGGFIITGNAPKKVILRAIGPSLAGAGILNPLADPILELHDASGSLITSNDNWRSTQEAEIIASAVAPTNDLESAIVSTLTPGNYTAVMNGKNGGTGVGLVEGYDLDQAADSQLANISTRGFVETGNNVMIGGFILGNVSVGGGSANVLIRALGPSLTQAGVSGALVDPTLELHSVNGTLLQSNDNWKDTQQTEIVATGVPPQNDLESAIVATLPPGNFTAIVAGQGGLTGVGLVEVYRLP
jgi:plastocyanin